MLLSPEVSGVAEPRYGQEQLLLGEGRGQQEQRRGEGRHQVPDHHHHHYYHHHHYVRYKGQIIFGSDRSSRCQNVRLSVRLSGPSLSEALDLHILYYLDHT